MIAPAAPARPSAFFRVEGTLTRTPVLASAAYLAASAPHLAQRLTRLAGVAIAAPLRLASPLEDDMLGTRMAWASVRGLSADRLHVLGEEYFDRYLRPSLRAGATALLERARDRGDEIVLVSENVDVVVAPLAKHLKVRLFASNTLELRDGMATGRLEDPVLSAAVLVRWARSFAATHGIDLGASLGYATNHEDAALLQLVGKPCAVTPDPRLRRIARDLDWPVVEA